MNVFKILKRGNVRGEEYFSASLGILLKEIPELTSFLIEKILGIEIEIEDYEIELEDTFPYGRIDIAIKSLPLEVYIENKISADLGETQLERYYNYIHQRSNKSKLILLSRDLIEDESIKYYADKYIFWSELFTLIENFYKNHHNYIKTREGGKIYLLSQFLDFLREENMSNEKVSWEYARGLKSFLNLLNMIQSVLSELRREKHLEAFGMKSIGKDYAGFYINDKKFWIGIYYNEPEKLCFEILRDFREKYKEEIFRDLEKSPGGEHPSYLYDFQKNYFLAFSKEEQKKAIYEFIRSNLSGLENLIKEKEG